MGTNQIREAIEQYERIVKQATQDYEDILRSAESDLRSSIAASEVSGPPNLDVVTMDKTKFNSLVEKLDYLEGKLREAGKL